MLFVMMVLCGTGILGGVITNGCHLDLTISPSRATPIEKVEREPPCVIPVSAVKAFLKAPRDDHRWIKKLGHKELNGAIYSLPLIPQLYPKLTAHQKACFLLGVSYPQFAFYVDMGGGKTLVAYELLQYWYQVGKLRRAIIFIKTDKAFPTWEDQLTRFNINVPLLCLDAPSSLGKWDQLSQFGPGLIIVPYISAVAMVHKRKPGKKKGQWKLDDKLIAKLGENVDAIVMDESTVAGGNSLIHDLCCKLAKKALIRYALAGRPFGRDPTLLYRQQLIIDGGESLGATLGLFRAAFFTEEDNPWDAKGYAKNYTFKKSMMDEVSRLAQHRSITYEEAELGDILPLVSIPVEIKLPQEAGAYYRRLVDQAKAVQGNWRELKNVFLRMRQLSSGFIGFKNDETGEKAEIEFDVNPKLERLLDLIEDVPLDRKILVFYEFTISGRKISKELTKLKIDHVWIWSGTKDARGDLKRFQKAPQCRVVVLNNKIGAFSLDGLQVANYLCFYESPVSNLDREQAERRVRRKGQQHKVFQYDLIVKGTQDKRILEFHKEGKSLFDAFRADPSLLCK